VAAYQARFHREPSSLAAQGYDAAKVLFDSMARAKTLSSVDIRQAIAETKGFQGATGTITMDDKRNADKPLVVVQVRDGKFRYVATANGSK
jgi:branched-chain amino acid transport system substrate-binding protein